MNFLIIFYLSAPNDLAFPRYEQLEQFVRERGWDSVAKEAGLEVGIISTGDSEAMIMNFIRPRLLPSDSVRLAVAPEFRTRDQLHNWALEYWRSGSTS